MNVCQTCGDKGTVKDLVYCVECQISAEHRYCMDTLPRKAAKKVFWTCEECSPRDAKPSPAPSRKSERISEASKSKLHRKKMRKEISFSKVNEQTCADRLTKARPLICDSSCPQGEIKTESTSQDLENEKLRKPRRRLVIEDGSSSDEKSEFVECSVVNTTSQSDFGICDHQLNKSHSLSSSETDGYFHAQPISNPIWKGCFTIQSAENQTSIGLMAHVSSKACSKVYDAARALPFHLNIEISSRSDAWPLTYQKTPLTDESIALYFFPENERDEKVFDSLIDELINHDRALKATINNLELLVSDGSIICGVCLNQPVPLVQGSNAEVALPSNLASNIRNQVRLDLAKTDPSTPFSSLSKSNSHTSDPKNFPFHEKLEKSASECISSLFLKHA